MESASSEEDIAQMADNVRRGRNTDPVGDLLKQLQVPDPEAGAADRAVASAIRMFEECRAPARRPRLLPQPSWTLAGALAMGLLVAVVGFHQMHQPQPQQGAHVSISSSFGASDDFLGKTQSKLLASDSSLRQTPSELSQVVSDGRMLKHDEATWAEAVQRYEGLLREMLTVFPDQLEAIVVKNGEVNLQLAEGPRLLQSQPVFVEIRSGQQITQIVGFSGDTVRTTLFGREVTMEVFVTGDEDVLLVSPELVWSSREPVSLDGSTFRAVPLRG